ncbi:uncharacterized protein IL334_004795 [Kwoniella shivajii]|uniref:Uncharacterized protein n=1 Tax=Kwoniella shivajii TaxID=564305 RepID=A0ABZ1D4C6_9TREE|nr:hypothetical protein IL334_004795 [Kwoniella shivajii]
MSEIHIEVQIHEIPKDLTIVSEHNKPSTYSTVMAWDQEFSVIFKRWHEHHHQREPLECFEFIFYPLGSPHPIPSGGGPGPVNNPVIINPDDTPKSHDFSGQVPLWVKRKHHHDEEEFKADA